MEIIMAIAIGVLAASGTWLLLRPRTFQVIIGLSLVAYAVNLFIFVSGSLNIAREPILLRWLRPTLENYTDPMPQFLVLTAIVIGFATTALFLVLLLAARGLADTDHVDGEGGRRMSDWIAPLMPHVLIAPILLPMLAAAAMLLLGERARSRQSRLPEKR